MHPRAPEPDREFTVQQAIEMCTTAISTYRINRRQLVEVYKALNQMGDQWQPKCERDSRTGVLRIRFGAYDIGDDGKFLAAGIITDTNPYAPFYNFRLLDSSGNVPGPGTAASAVQNKMAYFMDETRNAALVLSQLLPQLGTIAPTLGVDPTPLTKLRHRLAPFPYVPVRNQTTEIKEAFRAIGPSNVAIGPATIRTDDVPGFTPASRDKEIADDEPFFVDAKVALEHLLQAHWRAARALTGEFKESDGNMSGAPNPHGLLWLVERAKNVSPLHRALYGISLVVVVLIIVFGVIGDWKWALFGGVSILVVTILWNIVGSPRSHHANFAKWIVVGAFGVFVAMALVKLGVVLFAH